MPIYIIYIIFYILLAIYIIASFLVINYIYKYKHLGPAVKYIIPMYIITSLIIVIVANFYIIKTGFSEIITLNIF